jgi:hypothetical protein
LPFINSEPIEIMAAFFIASPLSVTADELSAGYVNSDFARINLSRGRDKGDLPDTINICRIKPPLFI